jgi:hypothetical protein
MNHSEQLIKIYAVGNTFDTIFKRTFPVSAVIHYLNEQGYLKIGQKNKFEGFKFKEKINIELP